MLGDPANHRQAKTGAELAFGSEKRLRGTSSVMPMLESILPLKFLQLLTPDILISRNLIGNKCYSSP
jgi:hypothetical protein